jgi:hypothetical protein
MKILITTYYGLKESLLCASKSLSKVGFECCEYPLFRYYADKYDKLDNYIDHFLDYIKSVNPDIILWWFIAIDTAGLEKIKKDNLNIKHIFFNWDEPFNWVHCDLENKSKYLDRAYLCSSEMFDSYKKSGCECFLLYPGYDPNIHYCILENKLQDEVKYSCDISIVCTNLYANLEKYPNQYICRKKLVDDIYNNQEKYNYKFFIYGPTSFEALYPKSYRGFINYEETNKVFNYSKINICTHVHNDKDKYLNERTWMILGSGGLLYIDKIKGIHENNILEDNKDCVIIDKENYIEQIRKILDNYNDYYRIRHYGFMKSHDHTWDKWAEFIKKIENPSN